LNIADFSIYKDSIVPIDEPIFEPIPPLIQFNDYEPLQIKEKIFKLRNRDSVARVVKIIKPDSRLFQVISLASLNSKNKTSKKPQISAGSKVAPGMSI
jgi:hydrocephalus-inducing protein